MKQLLKNFIFAGVFIFFIASPVAVVALPQATHAAPANNCEKPLFGVVPPWYRGLTNADCTIKSPEAGENGLSIFIWKIVLNVIQMALVLASFIAVFFILYGGFLFITGGGVSAQVEKGRKSIFSAVIGLIISMGAIAITNLIFGLVEGASTNNEYGVPEITADKLLASGLNLAYYIGGIVAVIVIIIAGLTYITSMGDSSRVNRSKSMILYAVIGLGILMAAFAITNFVVTRFQ